MRHADPSGLGSRASTPAEMWPATVPRTPASYHGVHLRCWISDVTRGSSSGPGKKSSVWFSARTAAALLSAQNANQGGH